MDLLEFVTDMVFEILADRDLDDPFREEFERLVRKLP